MTLGELTSEQLEHLVNTGKMEEFLRTGEIPTSSPILGDPRSGNVLSKEPVHPLLQDPVVALKQDIVVEGPPVVISEVPPFNEHKVASVSEPIVPPQQLTTQPMPDGFEIMDPVELLTILDEDIGSGVVKLHPWQIRFMLDFAAGGVSDCAPFQAVVRACNGSGKDKFVIAACAVWLCMRYGFARCVVTSSSGVQLDNQTEAYIRMLCEAANKRFGFLVWKCNYRYYECLATQSPILLFATDEPGKAEGYHPLKHNAKMALFESEAKTVPDEIYIAQNKCTGYTHRAIVSTPGPPYGHFYELCQLDRSVFRTDVSSINSADPMMYIQYHITAYQCSHIPKQYIEQMKRDLPGHEHGAAFQSQVMAEFGTTDEMVVIPHSHVWRSVNSVPVGWLKEDHNTGGLDLSAGGDETVLSVRNGNKLLAVIPFRFDNTQDTVRFLEEKFREYNLNNPKSYIYADAGGLGKPIIDQLRERGWVNIRYVLNQAKAYDGRVYANRGAEMWFNFGKLLETREIWLINDGPLLKQLASRYYKILPTNIHQLESKLQARAKGRPSPDRGDSVVLCYCQYRSKLEPGEVPDAPFEQEEEEAPKPLFTLKKWAEGEKTTPLSMYPNAGCNRDTSLYRRFVNEHNEMVRARNKEKVDNYDEHNEQVHVQ